MLLCVVQFVMHNLAISELIACVLEISSMLALCVWQGLNMHYVLLYIYIYTHTHAHISYTLNT